MPGSSSWLEPLRRTRVGGKHVYMLYRCLLCGTEKEIRESHVDSGRQVSCGCYARNRRGAAATQFKHGGAGTPEYKSWSGMIARCYNPNTERYPHYGGRGIEVCERWRHSFSNFLSDMGLKPSPEHSIDRIDNDGDYEPGNCRWATAVVQVTNRRVTRLLDVDGEALPLSEWARRTGIAPETIAKRIKRGWPVRDAIYGRSRPFRQRKPPQSATCRVCGTEFTYRRRGTAHRVICDSPGCRSEVSRQAVTALNARESM